MVATEFAKTPVGSITVGVVSESELVWTKSYGSANMEKHLPADKDTVYRIGSVTKMFTGVMLDQLVEAGKVHLPDPVSRCFPESLWSREITQHTDDYLASSRHPYLGAGPGIR